MLLIKADQSNNCAASSRTKIRLKKLPLEEAHVWGISSLTSSSPDMTPLIIALFVLGRNPNDDLREQLRNIKSENMVRLVLSS